MRGLHNNWGGGSGHVHQKWRPPITVYVEDGAVGHEAGGVLGEARVVAAVLEAHVVDEQRAALPAQLVGGDAGRRAAVLPEYLEGQVALGDEARRLHRLARVDGRRAKVEGHQSRWHWFIKKKW